MTTPEAKFALFYSNGPSRQTREQNEAWTRLTKSLHGASKNNKDVRMLGESAAWITLPAGLPILGQFLADVRDSGLAYTVQMFGQPILSYEPAEPEKEE